MAVADNTPVTEQELKYALHALYSIYFFVEQDLQELCTAILSNKDSGFIKLKARFAQGTIERMFKAKKAPVDKWLGESAPGSPEQQKWLKIGKKILDKIDKGG